MPLQSITQRCTEQASANEDMTLKLILQIELDFEPLHCTVIANTHVQFAIKNKIKAKASHSNSRLLQQLHSTQPGSRFFLLM